MDAIKLRAWDIKRHDMYYIDDLYFFEEEGIHEIENGLARGHHATYQIMQYIGKKDINGREIYVGDIVLREFASGQGGKSTKYKIFPAEVIYSEFNMSFMTAWPSNLGSYNNVLKGFQHSEVIGNIYETPELRPE